MPDDRYNIVFSGQLVSGADAGVVKERVGAIFRLDANSLETLFSGQTATIKRDVDLLTATRYQQAFLQAGARVEIEPADVVTDAPAAPMEDRPARPSVSEPEAAGLSLAPLGTLLEELDDRGPARNPDTSAFSLLPVDGWDLSDCEQPPAAPPRFDLDALSLVPLDSRPQSDGQ
jgi:hypothetical protein